jgi:hypothetical protein
LLPVVGGIGCASDAAMPPQKEASGALAAEAALSCDRDVAAFHAGPAGVGLEVPSESGEVTVRILGARPSVPAKYRNDWTIQFLAKGAPLNDVVIEDACAWMHSASHNHGGPAMAVTQLADRSTYWIEDLSLFMHGEWSIELAITPPNLSGAPSARTTCSKNVGTDRVVIPACVPDEGE